MRRRHRRILEIVLAVLASLSVARWRRDPARDNGIRFIPAANLEGRDVGPSIRRTPTTPPEPPRH